MPRTALAFRRAVVLSSLALTTACHPGTSQAANRANFTAAVTDYLAQRGHLCLAKYDWPIRVTPSDVQARSLDAQQMPVLEALGLVSSRSALAAAKQPGEPPPTADTREYALTPEGQKYYLHVPVVIATATQHIVHPADFCVATLSLDRLIGWEKPQTLGDRAVTSVLFTYQIDPAPWTQTPEARRAFPMVTRAVENAHTQQLRLGVHLTPDGWVADELSDLAH